MRSITTILRLAGTMMLWIIGAFIALWLLGRVASDRWMWSQWLSWIPALAALIACAAAVALAVLYPVRSDAARRRRVIGWGIVTVLVVIDFTFLEHRFRRKEPAPLGFKLVHWNPSLRLWDDEEDFVEPIMRFDGDVTILTNASLVSRSSEIRQWLGPQHRPMRVRSFVVLSRLPVQELRWLVDTEDIAVVLLVVDARPHVEELVAMYLVDLPSDPLRHRMETVKELKEMLRDAGGPPPDLLVGDLNITRGSASLDLLAEDLHHAYEEAGHGYGATFPRQTPLYHIDHVLLSNDLRCERYDIVDPGAGYHRAQVAWVRGRVSSQ